MKHNTNNDTWKVKSPEDWLADIEHESRGNLGRWRILPREIFSSRAYRDLSLSEREVLNCYLNKVVYCAPSPKDKRRMKSAKSVPANGDSLIVTNNEIIARGGVRSDSTISRARKRLVEIGFLDVVTSAAFPHSGVFALSERFKQYPNGDYKRKDMKPVSFVRYSRSCELGSNRFGRNSDQAPVALNYEEEDGNLINSCRNYSEENAPKLQKLQLQDDVEMVLSCEIYSEPNCEIYREART